MPAIIPIIKKKVFYLLLPGLCLFSVQVRAQTGASPKIPTAVTNAFTQKFPDASRVQWGLEEDNMYEATFHLHQKKCSAEFDATGAWQETETPCPPHQLPAAVQQALKKEFPDFKMKESNQLEDPRHGNCYEVEMKKGSVTWEVVLGQDGKVLDKVQEAKGSD